MTLDLNQYNDQNIFAKIIRGELPAQKLHEDQYVVAFPDANPQASIHILVIPKGRYTSFHDFSQKASPDEHQAFWKAISALANQYKLDETGYRLITNHGEDSGQEVSHFHVHLVGGQPLGPLVTTI